MRRLCPSCLYFLWTVDGPPLPPGRKPIRRHFSSGRRFHRDVAPSGSSPATTLLLRPSSSHGVAVEKTLVDLIAYFVFFSGSLM
jgi:hypothetical protein